MHIFRVLTSAEALGFIKALVLRTRALNSSDVYARKMCLTLVGVMTISIFSFAQLIFT
jgi:hypothetical protein